MSDGQPTCRSALHEIGSEIVLSPRIPVPNCEANQFVRPGDGKSNGITQNPFINRSECVGYGWLGRNTEDVVRCYGGDGVFKLLCPIRTLMLNRHSCKFPYTWGQDNPRGYPEIGSGLNGKQISSGCRGRDEPSCAPFFQFLVDVTSDAFNVSGRETLGLRIRGIDTPTGKGYDDCHWFL